MNKIEEYKREKDGLDVLADVSRYAQEGWEAITEGDRERLKWTGVFFRKQTPGLDDDRRALRRRITFSQLGQFHVALRKICPEPFLEMNPSDARNCGIRDADFVEVESRRGKAVVQVRVTAETRPGTCFMPFHWGRQFGFYKAANNLTLTARDPVSGQPELKACAVRVRKALDFPHEDAGHELVPA
jgi:formylmethanofuran dehydrogenase subunit D